jgi:preprotein translocase subunit SecF
MKARYKRLLWTVVIVIVVLASGLVLFINSVHFGADTSEENELKFDKKQWVQQNKVDPFDNNRHYMLSDLKRHHLKKGMDSMTVIKMLGNPERNFGFSYDLGFYESGFDHSFLILEFDDNGKLIKSDVKTI